jgi:hypothetical protein
MANNRKRVALIGKIGSGKTTLKQRLSKDEIKYEKTQMITYYDDFILTLLWMPVWLFWSLPASIHKILIPPTLCLPIISQQLE